MLRRLLPLILSVALLTPALTAPAWAQTSPGVLDAAALREQEFAQLAEAVAALERQGNLLKRLVRLVKPSVVHIEAKKTERSGQFQEVSNVEEAGSGVIVAINGGTYVLTNRHVIKDSTLRGIKIVLDDGRRLFPSQIWTDADTDVAVMKIVAKGLTPTHVGDSNKVEIGDFVVAVGSPFGLSHSVTYGIISAKGRRDLELGEGDVRLQDFMQTDAAINPGNSGGPLLNLRGELIGVNTAIASSSGGNEGIGFAIPINMAMSVAEQLVTNGRVARGYLGVHMDSNFNSDVAARMGLPYYSGAKISHVTANSPAENAGIRVEDVIIRFNGRLVENDAHLVNLVGLAPIGEKLSLLVYREGKPVKLEASLMDRAKLSSR